MLQKRWINKYLAKDYLLKMLRKEDLKKLKQGLAEVGSKDQPLKKRKGKIWILLPRQDDVVTETKTNLLIQISMIDVFVFYLSLAEKSMVGVSALMWPWPKVSPLRYTITHPHNHIQWCPSQWLHCSFLDQATVFSNSYTHSYKHSNSNPNIANVAVSPSPGAPSFSLLSGHQTLKPNTSSPFSFAFVNIQFSIHWYIIVDITTGVRCYLHFL